MRKLALLATFCLGHAACADDFYAACLKQNGQIEILHENQLKPGATLADFQKAVALQNRWYQTHGYPNDQVTLFTIGAIAPNSVAASSSTLVGTLHIHPSLVPAAQHDAAWDAFVAAYKAASTVTLTQPLCVLNTPQ